MIIVYELASNGSLDDYLGTTDKMTNFTWVQRINLCLDIANGLNYIHNSLDKQKIIHRDIKSANILLNDKWEAMIADFGLSKSYRENQQASSHMTNNVAGTTVYLDPEYEKTGRLKKASDIYSFGVILFEILCGRLAYDPMYMKENDKGLAPIARRRFEERKLYEMLDPKLKEENDENIFTKGLNQESLDTFTIIAYECVAETQSQRPTMEFVIDELKMALYAQKNITANLKMSLEDIELATQNFSVDNIIGKGSFGKTYKGEFTHANGSRVIAAKRFDRYIGHGEVKFSTELEILLEFKHENVIGLVGYCDEMDEKVIIYEYASRKSLDRHLKSVDLTWMKRLKICIEVATVLEFFHGAAATREVVIQKDIKSDNILLMEDWKAKLSDFGFSLTSSVDQEMDDVISNSCGTNGYVDLLYMRPGFLTRDKDIYSFGVVLLEILSGNLLFTKIDGLDQIQTSVLKRLYEEGRFDEMVFEGIKEQIVPNSLATFLKVAYQCLNKKRKRPSAREVAVQLKKALDIQMDCEIWEPKLPKDYREIIEISSSPEIYSDEKKEDLYNIFSNGILLHKGDVMNTSYDYENL
ncbi:putative receptor-like protein kinase At5g39000 isoform X2 [Rutidosis leptorrhynchoides]|uniref:putative receptor-like protein kinase At5g39000 isoform X2 n=1 Tax=Rutidosis leptorrhynchoides TaxID=125765 RepID=UPI003A98DAC3